MLIMRYFGVSLVKIKIEADRQIYKGDVQGMKG